MARILILRARQAATATAVLVESFGDTPLLLPTRQVEQLDPPAPLGPFGGLVVTSANAVSYLARHPEWCRLPALAVGGATAQALRAARFEVVEAGPGTAEELVVPAIALYRKAGLPLLYPTGIVRRPDLEVGLAEAGVPCRTIEVYRDRSREPSGADVDAVLAQGPPDAVLLLSRAQAQDFMALRSRFPDRLGDAVAILCLSPRIAALFEGADAARVVVSEKPELSALLARYRSLCISGLD
ncbi:uroporphyrinogen-III synthase [Aureimonas mangrovi]|uniref:uroporphyrinogen-III synthase n=1 Tax=Aureimonas mangrovi TaxID=2758041 RepID=UPI00163DA0CF|nr:uroporphyrinogen-III synthase [Aureimonas mangrovi]